MEPNKELMEHLKRFKINAFLDHLEEVESSKLSLRAALLELCRHESNRKHNESVNKSIIKANFPKIKTINMIDYKITPRLPKKIVDTLSTCEFIDKKLNAVFVGNSGAGKTHLAIALGVEACNRGYSVKFFVSSELVNNLISEYNKGVIEQYLKKLKRIDLLIIDELGYCPFSKQGASLLFRVISDRYENASTILTSNLSFSQWVELFLDKTMTTALLDRVTHNATIIKYDWESVRIAESLKNKALEKEEDF